MGLEQNQHHAWLLRELQFLYESERRLQILFEVSYGVNTGRSLKEKINSPKASLNRCLNQLIKRGLIDSNGKEFFVTEFGSAIAKEIKESTERIASIYEAKEFFSSSHLGGIPHSMLTNIEMLSKMESVNIPKLQPYLFSDYYQRMLEKSKTIKAVLPMQPVEFKQFIERLNFGSELDLIVTEKVFDLIKEDLDQQQLRRKNFQLSIIDADKSLILSIFDKCLLLGFENNGSEYMLRILSGKTDEAIKWGENLFSYYKNIARPLKQKLSA